MSGSVNKVILVGHLGKDPESKATNDGGKVVWFSLATSDRWRDKNTGERRERTEWHQIVVFNEPLGDIAVKYLRKGSLAFIEGELRTRKWTDQGGTERYRTEVVIAQFRGQLGLLDRAEKAPAPDEGAYGTERSLSGDGAAHASAPANTGGTPPMDDEIPF
jgi:single-strand DNA-binding protein